MRFPGEAVNADIFQPWDCNSWPQATLVVVLTSGELQLALSGDLAAGEVSDCSLEGKAIVDTLEAFSLPCPVTAVRAFERSARAGRALLEGEESHAWAIAGLRCTEDTQGASPVVCLALPKSEPQVLDLEEKPPGLPEPSMAAPAPPVDISTVPSASVVLRPQPGAAEAPEVEAEGPQGGASKDSDAASADMLLKISSFMERRAKLASDGVFQSFKEGLPAAVAAGTGGRASSSQVRRKGKHEEQSAPASLQSIIKDSMSISEQVARSEKVATTSLKQMSDPAMLKQANGHKSLRDAIEKELGKWRDGVMSKSVLKTVESKEFSEQFLAGLLSASEKDAGPLLNALRPQPAQLQEAFQADFQEWCGTLLTQKTKHGLLQEQDLRSSRTAFDYAMVEVSNQSVDMFSKFLEETSSASKASQLSSRCSEEVVGAVRREIENYRRSPLPAAQSGGSSVSTAPGAAAMESFARRMRAAVAPLTKDLDSAARDIALAGASLERCKAVANSCGATAGASTSTLADVRGAMLADLGAGSVRAALEQALAWDAAHQGQETSLVELLCDHLQSSAGNGLADPPLVEEILLRPDVASQLDGRLQSLLLYALLERSTSEAMQSVARIEVNLEWALGLLQAAPQDAGLAISLEAIRDPATAFLESLVRGKTPAKLDGAAADVKRRISKSARLAMKALSLLLPRK